MMNRKLILKTTGILTIVACLYVFSLSLALNSNTRQTVTYYKDTFTDTCYARFHRQSHPIDCSKLDGVSVVELFGKTK